MAGSFESFQNSGDCPKGFEHERIWNVVVKNTFIHILDENTPKPMPRSHSEDGAVSSSQYLDSSSTLISEMKGTIGIEDEGGTDSILGSNATSPDAYSDGGSRKSFGEQPAPADSDLPVFPSTGSASHTIGRCKPCRFLPTYDGCRKGSSCNFCHFQDHVLTFSKSRRPSKGVRASYENAVRDITSSGQSRESKLAALAALSEEAGSNHCIETLVKKASAKIKMQSTLAAAPCRVNKPNFFLG